MQESHTRRGRDGWVGERNGMEWKDVLSDIANTDNEPVENIQCDVLLFYFLSIQANEPSPNERTNERKLVHLDSAISSIRSIILTVSAAS